MNKSLLTRSIVAGAVLSITLCGLMAPLTISADSKADISVATLVHNGHLTICKLDKSSYHVVKTTKMLITAYSSTVDQTDDTPFITASGKHVADDIIANNRFPFGTKIRIPALFGDKVFTVGDRMHPRMGKDHIDIWFPEYIQAKKFGSKVTEIEVLEN